MLVPQPRQTIHHEGHVTLSGSTRLHARAPVANLVRELLGPATGLPLPDAAEPGDGVVSLRVVDDAALGEEGYRLRVTGTSVEATAAAEGGLRWAVQTLRQLLPDEVYAESPVRGVDWRLPCVDITDVPAYSWRGSLLDVARWYRPLPFLYRYVDLLAMHKLNTLHLHLTDDQGWRFEVQRYPLLTEVGGFRPQSPAGHARESRFDGVPHGGFYTQRDLRELVDYAARRGVRIMPEVDVPGHCQAAIAAYPQFGTDPARQLAVGTRWGIFPHVLGVDDATIAFVRDVLDELVEVFPFEYVHIGGDEVPLEEWAASPDALRRATQLGLSQLADLQGWWAAQLAAHLAGHGRRVGVWDELLERGAPPDATVFAWRGEDRVLAAVTAGHDVVAAPYTHTYLDWAEAHGPDEPLAIAGVLPLEKVYGYRPGTVLGVQGQVWGEYLPTDRLIEWRAFPRLSALAEVGWSGTEPIGGLPDQERDIEEFRGRLVAHLRRLDRLGVRYRPLD